GIRDQVGTIEVGKQADMVLIDGDPHSDPDALRNIWAVFQSGRRLRLGSWNAVNLPTKKQPACKCQQVITEFIW
ncbi:MAG: amidohydrolase family protein, partial [Planctomycetes bacterium]|nr:amidohydrolase family protein [Planctomycetota bacterium]